MPISEKLIQLPLLRENKNVDVVLPDQNPVDHIQDTEPLLQASKFQENSSNLPTQNLQEELTQPTPLFPAETDRLPAYYNHAQDNCGRLPNSCRRKIKKREGECRRKIKNLAQHIEGTTLKRGTRHSSMQRQ